MIWLVTGGSGFLGKHLLDRLRTRDVEVVSIGRRAIPETSARWCRADLNDPASLENALRAVRPDVVIHLAGKTPPAEFEALDRANRQSTHILVRTLEAIARPVRLVVAGSAAELGSVPESDLPVDETYSPRPETEYGRTKLAASMAALAAKSPVEPIVARIFNPIGPGLPTNQALGRFAGLLAEGTRPLTLNVGDLSPRRDFIDVRDAVDAIVALGFRGKSGLYHVGAGRSRSVGEGLETLIRLSGREVRIEVDPTRPSGPADSRADARKLRDATGWKPKYAFEQSLTDLWTSVVAGCD